MGPVPMPWDIPAMGPAADVMTRAQLVGVIIGFVHRRSTYDPAGKRSGASEAGARCDIRRIPAPVTATLRGHAGACGRHRRNLAARIRPVAVAARPAWRRSSTGWPQWAPRSSPSTCCLPSPTACRRATSCATLPGVEPSLLEQLPDNDEIFAQSIVGRPVVLGFGLSNQGNYRPPVKAGFAFTGESPINAPPHFTAATPFRPQLEAAASASAISASIPGAPSAVVRDGSAFPERRRATLSQSRHGGAARRARRVDLSARRRTRRAGHHHHGQDRRFRGAGDRGRRALALCQSGQRRSVMFPQETCWRKAAPPRKQRQRSKAASSSSEPRPPACRTSAPPRLARTFPGVSLHAQTVEQILSGRFLSRPDWADGLEILCDRGARRSPGDPHHLRQSGRSRWSAGLLITALALVASWLAFLYGGLLFDPLAPIVTGIHHPFRGNLVPLSGHRPAAPRNPAGLRPIPFALAAVSHRTYPKRPAPRRRRSRTDGDVRRCPQFHRDQRKAVADGRRAVSSTRCSTH